MEVQRRASCTRRSIWRGVQSDATLIRPKESGSSACHVTASWLPHPVNERDAERSRRIWLRVSPPWQSSEQVLSGFCCCRSGRDNVPDLPARWPINKERYRYVLKGDQLAEQHRWSRGRFARGDQANHRRLNGYIASTAAAVVQDRKYGSSPSMSTSCSGRVNL